MILAEVAPTQPLPESWFALAGFAALLVFQAVQTWQNKRIQTTAGKTEAQVTNGGSNLAATVGEVKEMVGNQGRDISGIRQDIGGLRGEVRDEREARIELARTLEDRLKQLERRRGA